jgi:hypothetical protein
MIANAASGPRNITTTNMRAKPRRFGVLRESRA